MIGRYEVCGRRAYRGHSPGSTFEARLDSSAEARAIRRGAIELVEHFTPGPVPGSYTFPDGWLDQPQHRANEAAQAASLIQGGR
jgi:hypothetical protein